MKEFIIEKEIIENLSTMTQIRSTLLSTIKKRITSGEIKIKNVKIDTNVIKSNVNNFYNYHYSVLGKNNLFNNKNINTIIRQDLAIPCNSTNTSFTIVIPVYFIIINNILFFYSDKFYNDNYIVEYNDINKNNEDNEKSKIVIINSNSRYKIYSQNNFLNIGNAGINDKLINKCVYKEINYSKLFIGIFPIVSTFDLTNSTNIIIDFLMPKEYDLKVNTINKHFNFSNKTEPFKNVNSGNHLIYFYETFKDYMTWKS